MSRHYKPIPGQTQYKKVTADRREAAKRATEGRLSYRAASEEYGIPKSVLHRHKTMGDLRSQGGNTVLSHAMEDNLVKQLITCANWGGIR